MNWRTFGFLLVAATALWLPTLSHAQQVEEFYRGKKLTLYIGSSSGGGTDIY